MSVASVGSIPVSTLQLTTPSSDAAQGQAVKQQPEPNKNKPPQVTHSAAAAAAEMEQIGLVFNKKLRFVVDRDSNEVIIKVIDKDTDKVIKELPPEELQRMHSNVKEVLGFLFDERV